MMEDINNIDQLFRSNLSSYSEKPPEELWSSIEKDLAKNRKRIILPLYFKIAAGIIVLLGLGTITWNYLRVKTDDSQVAIFQSPSIQQSDIKPIENSAIVSSQIQTEDQKKVIATQKVAEKKNDPGVASQKPFIPSSEQTLEQSITHDEVQMTVQPESESTIILAEEVVETPVSNTTAESIVVEEKEVTATTKNDLIIQQNLLALEQEKEESDNNPSRVWSVGGQAGPQYSYRYVDVKEPDVYLNNANKNQYENPILAYAGGIQIEMEPSTRFSIQSGVFYSKIGHQREYPDNDMRGEDIAEVFDPSMEEVNYIGTIAPNKQINNFYNTDLTNIDISVSSVERYLEFLEIPFIFSYKIINKKLDMDISSGIWADLLIGNKAYITTGASNTDEYSNKNIGDFNCSASIGFGLYYPLLEKLNFSLKPVFKYYLSPVNTDPATNVYPYSFGLMSGLRYTF